MSTSASWPLSVWSQWCSQKDPEHVQLLTIPCKALCSLVILLLCPFLLPPPHSLHPWLFLEHARPQGLCTSSYFCLECSSVCWFALLLHLFHCLKYYLPRKVWALRLKLQLVPLTPVSAKFFYTAFKHLIAFWHIYNLFIIVFIILFPLE